MENSAERALEIGKIISDTLFVEIASPDDDLLANGTLDSISLIQVLLQLEARFGIRISLDELELDDVRSLSSIARLVESYEAVRETAVMAG